MVHMDLNQKIFFMNRELSWLEFNNRVLQEARDRKNPLFERLKFLAIASSNLDEFFMIRFASLRDQVNAGYSRPDASGLTPQEQLENISFKTHRMIKEQYTCYNRAILPALKRKGVHFLSPEVLNQEQKTFVEAYFTNVIYPVLTPMVVDSSRPFPLILNKSLNLGILVRRKEAEGEIIFATVQIPSVLPRAIELPSSIEQEKCFILLEDVIGMKSNLLFSGHEVICAFPYRITRNADLSIEEEEAEDLLIEIEKSLKKRKWGAVVRLEVDECMDGRMIQVLKNALEIHEDDIYYIGGSIDLTFLMKIYSLNGFKELKYPHHEPQIPVGLLEEEDIFKAISKEDIFLHHPYDSFEPIIEFVNRAAADPKVLAIKQTLYRVSGDSPVVKALEEAAERGKQVTVLVEVKARFDEENNIQWAKRLEKAGCHVIYGLVGLKTHCKITLVVRLEEAGIKRYVHLGTGNYNDITARYYTDMGLFTCNEAYGADASAVFNMLSGYSEPPLWQRLEIAPEGLRGKFLQMIKNEMQHAQEGKKSGIIAKVNSLADTEIIAALYEASTAGVKIDLIVRGICCLIPGVPGVSENITVRSIVGRFLEHSRIFYFYNEGQENVFLSSADWMHRNLDKRVEVLFPIENPRIKQEVIVALNVMLEDTMKARLLTPEGTYKKVDRRGKKNIEAQRYFTEAVYERTRRYNEERIKPIFETMASDQPLIHHEVALDSEE